MDSPTNKTFYGWWILIAASVFSFAATIASSHDDFAFKEAIIDYLFAADPSYRLSSVPYALRSLSSLMDDLFIGVIAAPVFGFLLDRHGPRPLMLFGIALAAIGFLMITQVQNDWQRLAATFVISLGFSATTGVVLFATLGKWFARKRVLVFAIFAAGSAASEFFLIDRSNAVGIFGWQYMAVASGIVLCVVGIPAALAMRRRPEESGLTADGGGASPKLERRLTRSDSTKLRSVFRNRAFWQINVALGLSLAGSTLWIDPLSVGWFRTTLLEISLIGYAALIVVIAGILIIGVIGLRRKPTVLILAMLAIAAIARIGITFVHLVDEVPLEYLLFTFFSGGGQLASASLLLLQLALLADYFGTRRFGAIVGVAFGINAAMKLAFPMVSGFASDAYVGDPDGFVLTALVTGILAILVAAALVLLLESQSRVAARLRLARRVQ